MDIFSCRSLPAFDSAPEQHGVGFKCRLVRVSPEEDSFDGAGGEGFIIKTCEMSHKSWTTTKSSFDRMKWMEESGQLGAELYSTRTQSPHSRG